MTICTRGTIEYRIKCKIRCSVLSRHLTINRWSPFVHKTGRRFVQFHRGEGGICKFVTHKGVQFKVASSGMHMYQWDVNLSCNLQDCHDWRKLKKVPEKLALLVSFWVEKMEIGREVWRIWKVCVCGII